MQPGSLVVGVGNLFRGDDAIGPVVADKIKRLKLPDVKVVVSNGDLTDLAFDFKKCELLIIIDSVSAGASPGTIYRLFPLDEVNAIQMEEKFSTHALGIKDCLKVLREIQMLPDRVIIYGIEGADFRIGKGLSSPVAASLDRLSEEIIAELRA